MNKWPAVLLAAASLGASCSSQANVDLAVPASEHVDSESSSRAGDAAANEATPSVIPPPDDVVASSGQTSQADAQAAVRMEVYMDVESGRVVEGEYVAEYPPDAMRWRLRLDIDPVARYAFWARDGQAEPGDKGCLEVLHTPDRAFSRENYLSDRSTEFIEAPDVESIFDQDEFETLPATTVVGLYADAGIELPAAEETGSGLRRTQALDTAQVNVIRDLLPNLGGVDTLYDHGSLETLEAEDGRLLKATFLAEYRGEEEAWTDSDGSTRSRYELETIDLQLSYAPLDPTVSRITPTSSLLESEACVPPTDAVPGTWRLLGIFTGDDVLPVEFFDQLAGANLIIDADGSISGDLGCRTLDGSFEFGFDRLTNVQFDVEGEPCTGRSLDVEENLLDLLARGPYVDVGSDGLLWMASTFDDAAAAGEVAVVFSAAG